MLPASKSRLEHQSFSNENWQGADLSDVKFIGCTLRNVNLSNADIESMEFLRCQLTNVNFSSAKILGLSIRHSSLRNVKFREAAMPGAHIFFSSGGNIDLRDAEMRGGIISHSYLFDLEADRADLKDTQISHCYLSSAHFADAIVEPQLWFGSRIPCGIRGAKLPSLEQARIAGPPRFLQLSDSLLACVLHTEEHGSKYFSANQDEITAAQFAASLKDFCEEFNIPLKEAP